MTHSFEARSVRYVRDYLNGSTANAGNHWVEIEVWGARTVVYAGPHYEVDLGGEVDRCAYTESPLDHSWAIVDPAGSISTVEGAGRPGRVLRATTGDGIGFAIRYPEGSSLNLQDVEFEQGYGQGWRPYAHSKLANVMFTYELARRLKDTGVTANALHPGFVATRFGLNNGTLMNLVMKSIQRLAAISPEKGAQTSVFLASAPAVEGVTGKYFSHSKITPSTQASYDTDIAGRLWDLSLDMI